MSARRWRKGTAPNNNATVKHRRVFQVLGVAGILFVVLLAAFRLDQAKRGQGAASSWLVRARPAEAVSSPVAAPAPAPAATPPNTVVGPAAMPAVLGLGADSSTSAFRQLAGGWNGPMPEAEFARFAEWAKRYLAAGPAARAALEGEGKELALARRDALRRLIRSDPARALALAVPSGVRRALPESITGLLEERISVRGSLDVLAALAEPGKENEVIPTFRVATIEGREYDAYVYGRRLGEPTRRDVVLNGVSVDDLFAVNETRVRLLEPEEAAALPSTPREPLCAISGNPSTVNNAQTVAEVAGQTVYLCGPAHVGALEEQLARAEVAGDTGGGGGEVAASTRTEGIKRLLVIRVDFGDLIGAPMSDSTGLALISGLNLFYAEMSYGRTGFYGSGSGSELTPTFRMPQLASYYGPNNLYNQLRTDARNAAAAAGYVLANYDYDIICFGPVPGWGWAGLGYVGAAGAWLRNYFTTGVAGHEVGHNYGLNHANFWDTGGLSVIGASGTSIEYGDIFDTMGSANAGANHFNASYKRYLNWLQASETTVVSSSGVYRIYAHDDPTATGVRALRIARSATENYSIEFRQKFTGNRWLMSGAGIRWAGNGNEKSHLLDTTPGSPDGKNDSALVLGRTFSDTAAGIHITTLRKGGTTPESLDIAVNLGAFPGNHPPTVAVAADAAAAAPGAVVSFTATAADSDGDTLAYYWDFGDSTFGTNGMLASKSWSSSGEYVVRCVASDMKGGIASDSVVVTVGSPTTYRISGQVLASGVPVAGVLVSATISRQAYTDSDGTYTITGLPAGSYTVSAVLDGYTFSPFGFGNPVSVGPSATGINFSTGGGGGGTITPGSVTLTSPINGFNYTAPATVFVAASAAGSTGTGVLKVEFYQGTTKIGEDVSTPFSYTWTGVAAGAYSLTARSIDSAGLMATSAPVAVIVTPVAPAITTQPASRTVTAGGNVTFSVTATGGAPLAYQWRYNGANLAGANSASLSLFNVQLSQAGGYSVVVTNGGGAVTSAVATLTVNCGYSLSASGAAFSSDGGDGGVTVTSQTGCSWTVSGVPAWITITSGNSGNGSGSVTYTVATNSTGSPRSATLTIAGKNYAVTQGIPDATPPSVAFVSPAAGASLTNTLLSVSGTASDDTGVARVECRVGSGGFALASGTANWSAQVTLAAGTNVLSVRSIDLSGNTSPTNTRTVFCSVPGTLNLDIHGNGTVKGGTNGQKLTIGKPYQLTATPMAGFVFSNWTGDTVSESPAITFLMQSNVTLSANFVTNPFVPLQGVFTGLFYETNEVRLGCSGAFSLKMTDQGKYSALLRLGSQRWPMSGHFNLEGWATNVVARAGTNALTVLWALDLAGSDQITGRISDGLWTAALLGDRAVFGKTNPPLQAGPYTLVLLGNPASALAPGGDSYGTAGVDPKGGVKVKMFLADKGVVTAKVPLSKNGHLPLYAPLYGGKGMLLGWVTFADLASTDFDGVLKWIKTSQPTLMYPNGFTVDAALLGSRYARPLTGAPILNLNRPMVTLVGSDLNLASTNSVVLEPDNTIRSLGPEPVSITFTLPKGLFSGQCTPALPALPVKFKGAVLQKANWASGHFFGPTESGQIQILEAGP